MTYVIFGDVQIVDMNTRHHQIAMKIYRVQIVGFGVLRVVNHITANKALKPKSKDSA